MEGGRFISEVDQGHCPLVCKVSVQMNQKHKNEIKNRKEKKVLFEKVFLKVGL